MTTISPTQPSFVTRYKRELIVGGACLIVGYCIGAFSEAYSYEKAIAQQIMANVTQQQTRLQQESKKFDEDFEKSAREFGKRFNDK